MINGVKTMENNEVALSKKVSEKKPKKKVEDLIFYVEDEALYDTMFSDTQQQDYFDILNDFQFFKSRLSESGDGFPENRHIPLMSIKENF